MINPAVVTDKNQHELLTQLVLCYCTSFTPALMTLRKTVDIALANVVINESAKQHADFIKPNASNNLFLNLIDLFHQSS
jgi:hypothetical protein